MSGILLNETGSASQKCAVLMSFKEGFDLCGLESLVGQCLLTSVRSGLANMEPSDCLFTNLVGCTAQAAEEPLKLEALFLSSGCLKNKLNPKEGSLIESLLTSLESIVIHVKLFSQEPRKSISNDEEELSVTGVIRVCQAEGQFIARNANMLTEPEPISFH
ncbi:hypothetical protein Ciccas_012742 [Cichlidogyrus casuarinus]|uniref:Uncharacterized protein n=1 Tax=Cichlidogyrus casuarinus TaxID=1844966 RepID=A0ABD2PSJ7_9PLAT